MNQWTNEDIQRVRDISIASELGGRVGRRQNIICPMPSHHDKTASFLIDENNGYYCFGCGVRGRGFIDLYTEILLQEGVDEKTIFQQIMMEYGDNK